MVAGAAQRAGWEQLVGVVQQLSMARDLDAVTAVVRRAARQLTGADGATFVLRDGDLCFYADEDAIEPLWKGKRFPMARCVSGWVMLNRQQTVIPDIYDDPRIPAEAYRPTFVRSMAMVPIRTAAPLGAIGNYWATPYTPSQEQVAMLQALADTTSVAMENVQLYKQLEQRVRDRTRELEAANKELEAFSYTVSHDLRAPLRSMDGFSRILLEDHAGGLTPEAAGYLQRVRASAQHMGTLIDDLLAFSHVSRRPLKTRPVDLGQVARAIVDQLQSESGGRKVSVIIDPLPKVEGDEALLRQVLVNLLSNAFKFTAKRETAVIHVGHDSTATEHPFFVRDNGAGFDMRYAEKLFGVFQRLHGADEFAGTGVGLAIVQRIIRRHSGRIWAQGSPGEGATFWFTLPYATASSPGQGEAAIA